MDGIKKLFSQIFDSFQNLFSGSSFSAGASINTNSGYAGFGLQMGGGYVGAGLAHSYATPRPIGLTNESGIRCGIGLGSHFSAAASGGIMATGYRATLHRNNFTRVGFGMHIG